MINGLIRRLKLYIIVFIVVINLFVVKALTIDIGGVKQGIDDITYAKDAPLANIIIDDKMITNSNNVQTSLLSSHKGFKIMTMNEIRDRTFTTDYNLNINSPSLVYDEGEEGARIITGNINSMNTFEGDIASFTYNDAALLPNGEKGNVRIVFSNISFPMQNNFGRHLDTQSFTAKSYGTYKEFYLYPNSRMAASLKQGNRYSDFWGYDLENDRGIYKKPGLYSVGYGYSIYSWNNIVRDVRKSASKDGNTQDYGFTTRNGLKMDIKIQVLDKNNNIVDGSFVLGIVDIDQDRENNENFRKLYNSNNEHFYSESIRINSGVDNDSDVYIPGDVTGESGNKNYKYTRVEKDNNGISFVGIKSEQDPGTTYSGFVTVIDNNSGVSLTFWGSGSSSAIMKSSLLRGNDFNKIVSSTGQGGSIKTTKKGNKTGDLTDGSDILADGKYDVANGKTVVYTMMAMPGYMIDSVKVDNSALTIPTGVGAYTSVGLIGPSERTGRLANLGNEEYTFMFPDNISNHEISVTWRTIAYKITYELNGGLNNIENPSSYTVEDEITIKSPAKEGYKFLGWEEGNKIPLGSTGDKHFTARWEKINTEINGIAPPITGDNIIDYFIVAIVSIIFLIILIKYSRVILKR